MIRIYCDLCESQIDGEYAEFNYLKTSLLDKGRGVGKQPIKNTFCVNCKDKLINFINESSVKKG